MSKRSELQLQILRKYEEEDQIPSSIQFEHLRGLFPEFGSNEGVYSDQLTYAVKSLGDLELLDLKYHDMNIDGARPAWIRIDSIVGLTQLGEEFIQCRHRANEPSSARKLLDRFADKIPSVLINTLIDSIPTISS